MPLLADDNAVRGDFGEAWLRVVAAGSGILHGRPSSLDLEKADVELTLRGLVAGMRFPTVKVQVKTTISARGGADGDLSYDLDVVTYDVLRQADHAVRRVLVVMALPAQGDLVRQVDDGTLLVGRALWTSLEGEPATDNSTTVTVTLPREQRVDPPGLRTMLERYGVRAPTPLPHVDEWRRGGDGG